MSTALLIIDMQQSLIDDETPNPDEIIAAVAGLEAAAKAAAVPVVYIADRRVGPNPGIIDALTPAPDDLRIEKGECNSFDGTVLADELAARGADHVVICGMQSDACVDATTRAAAALGYRVTLVGDGHTTHAWQGRDFRKVIADANDALSALAGVVVRPSQDITFRA